MDISLALNIITAAIKTRTDEISALQTASDLLSNTFNAEFTNLDVAVQEANQNAIEMQAAKNDAAAVSADRDSLKDQVDNLTVQLQTANNDAAAVSSSQIDQIPK